MTAWLDKLEEYEAAGFREVPGRSSNPVILKWAHGAGHASWVTDDATPWCGIGLAGILDEVGLGRAVPKEPARAISWAKCGVPCEPKPGAILVFHRTGGHHVTVIKSIEGNTAHCVGCNQSDAIKTSPFNLKERIACRWPVAEKTPDTSRIIAAAERQVRDKVKAGGSAGTEPVMQSLPAAPTGIRSGIDSALGDATWIKSVVDGVGDFAGFVGANWWFVAGGLALYFLARTMWDSYLIKQFRAEDHEQGYTP